MNNTQSKTITDKQFVIEVAKILQKGQLFKNNISKQILLEKLRKKYGLIPCEECGELDNYHKSECSEVLYHPAV